MSPCVEAYTANVCNVGMSSLPEMNTKSLRVKPKDCGHMYISGKLQVQLLCNTSKADSFDANTSLNTDVHA